jgi:hypothetical protein
VLGRRRLAVFATAAMLITSVAIPKLDSVTWPLGPSRTESAGVVPPADGDPGGSVSSTTASLSHGSSEVDTTPGATSRGLPAKVLAAGVWA